MHCIAGLLVGLGGIILFIATNSNAQSNPRKYDADSKPEFLEYSSRKGDDNPLMNWLFTGCSNFQDPKCNDLTTKDHPKPVEYPGYDGWYNNIGRPDLGAIDTPLLRRWPAAYEDGVYKPSGSRRPEPIELSDNLLKGHDNVTQSRTGKNTLLVFFGQQVVEEILDAQRPACPPEYFNINIPKTHRYREQTKHTMMPLLRTRYDATTGFSPNNPRQQLNEITPFLDGGLVYGTTKAWADTLRLNENGSICEDGLLATSHGGLFPAINTIRLPMANPPPPANHSIYTTRHSTEKVNRFFKLGNPRGNENPFLLTFGIVWFRWHNHVAKNLRRHHPEWSSDEVFNEARKWVIATQQYVVTKLWLREWLGADLPEYEGYDPSVDPQIDQFFQAAAFRFGHTLVPRGVYMRDYGRDGCRLFNETEYSVRTCNSFWRPQDTVKRELPTRKRGFADIDRLLMGMSVQLCEEEDHKIVEDLRGNVFGPLEFSRRDLMAINIQRARDHGLPDYNTARKAYNLREINEINYVEHFKHVNRSILDTLKKMYNNSWEDIDIWVGGIMETVDGPGELFRTVIKDQFRRIRDGDRFWYRNLKNGLFTSEEIERLENLTFHDILMSVTQMDPNDIPKNPFGVPISRDEMHKECQKILHEKVCSTKLNESVASQSMKCFHVKADEFEECIVPGTYDYFENSYASFILTFLGLATIIVGIMTWLLVMLVRVTKQEIPKLKELTEARNSINPELLSWSFTAKEWVDFHSLKKTVIIVLNNKEKRIELKNRLGHLTRALDLIYCPKITVFITTDNNFAMIRVKHNYDLVLKFESDHLRQMFLMGLEKFIEAHDIGRDYVNKITTVATLKQAVTQKHRQEKLEKFFLYVFSHATRIADSADKSVQIDPDLAADVINTELTITEFAEALSMRDDSSFSQKMFKLIDKDRNGFISFREFMDMLIVFFKGSAEEKIKLMFDMYDIDGHGKLKREDFINMLRSFTEIVNVNPEYNDLEKACHEMMNKAGLANQETINLEDFQRLLGEYGDKLSYAELEFNIGSAGKSKTFHAANMKSSTGLIGKARETAESLYADPRELLGRVDGKTTTSENARPLSGMDLPDKIIEKVAIPTDGNTHPVMKYIANKQLEIFWIALYTLVTIAIFVERAYYYSVEREHSGLRRIAGYGVTVTRGAASAMMFTYSSLLVTMCQNTLTVLRETFLQAYIPFDAFIDFHKYIACWAFGFTILHIIGHAFNFYHIATQTADDLTCLFPNYFHATHELPKFHYWCWQTMTGVTGIALTIVTALIFAFALPVVRRRLFHWFWYTHSLYPVFFILMILHGTGRLIQEPFMYYFCLGPMILFTLDKVVTASKKTIQIQIKKVDILPSGVTFIEFPKPPNFQYKSGQWVRIACPALNTNENHPFTLSSAPNEHNLTVHIRAVGPWTKNIRNLLDPALSKRTWPSIQIDGPYGEAHQDWYKYDVAIMVGGGIGVTPFASILKDIVFKSNHNINLGCKKVYFLWVTRTQKQFEWMVDILRDLEAADKKNVVAVHIFITQFYQKFDLRTILLYICERHCQKVWNKSLFTGLTATTHFGRPNFVKYLDAIQQLHTNVAKVGVFSCGASTMTHSVDAACQVLNKQGKSQTIFKHYYKTF